MGGSSVAGPKFRGEVLVFLGALILLKRKKKSSRVTVSNRNIDENKHFNEGGMFKESLS